MGAIASGGVVVLNDDVVRGHGHPVGGHRAGGHGGGRELERRERAYREDARSARRHRQGRDPRRRRARHRVQHAGRHPGAAATSAGADRGGRARRPRVDLPGADRRGRRGRVRHDPVAVLRSGPALLGLQPDHRRRGPRPAACGVVVTPDRRPPAAPRRGARPAIGARSAGRGRGRPSGTARARRRRPLRAVRRGIPRHARVLRDTGTHDPLADRGQGLLRRGRRSRLARRLPGEPLRARPQRRRHRRGGPARLRTVPDLDVAQRGDPGLRRLAARAQRPGRQGRAGQGRVLRARPLQPVPLHRRGHHLPRTRRPACRRPCP